MNYGLPYLGSKSKIVEDIIRLFPLANTFYDLFAGGCAVTHALLIHNTDLFGKKFNKIVINDINNAPKLFLDAIQGKYKNEKGWISRKMFLNNLKKKNSDPYIQWVWSFANNGKNYLFSKKLEPIKRAFHYVTVFDDWIYFNKLYEYDYLDELLKEYGVYDKKTFLDLYKNNFQAGGGRREHLRVIKYIQKNWIDVRGFFGKLQPLERLEPLEHLEQLQRLERLQHLEDSVKLEGGVKLERLQLDYRDIKIEKNSVVYCDIPYKIKGVKDYLQEEFDQHSFWSWAEKQNIPVYVSEYNYHGENPNKWEVVYEKEKRSCRNVKNNKIDIEKVFWNKI